MEIENCSSLTLEEWKALSEKQDEERRIMITKMLDYCCTSHDGLAAYLFEWLTTHLEHVEREDDERWHYHTEYLIFDGVWYELGKWDELEQWHPTCGSSNSFLK